MISGITPLVQAGMASGAQGIPASSGQAASGAHFAFKLPDAPQHVPMPGETAETQISEPTSWGQMIQRMALDVNTAQASAGEKVRDVLAGGPTPVHEAMIAMQESSVRFAMLSEVRNKLIDAYQEVMRMSV